MHNEPELWFKIFARLCNRGLTDWIPDYIYLKILYRGIMKKKLNLTKPRTFNEKLQWLKLYDRRKIYTTLVDKVSVKDYVEKIVGKQYIIPTLGVWDSYDDIDFSTLPEQFVLKCAHDSGGVVICTDKKSFDCQASKEIIEKSMKKIIFTIEENGHIKMSAVESSLKR